jgi:lysophospholipase L1-like esterase
MSQRHSTEWNVIDIHRPKKEELKMRRLKDPEFVFSKDGIHPNTAGHFLMAKEILLYLGV